MTVELLGGTLLGVQGVLVRVEVDVLSMLPTFTVVGLPHSSVREARERVRSAIGASNLPFPRRRITANLGPADLPKAGTGLDLPLALGVIACSEDDGAPWDDLPLAVGELGLDGRVRPVRGVLPVVEAAARAGCRRAIVAEENGAEAALVPGIVVLAVRTLVEAWAAARGDDSRRVVAAPLFQAPSSGPDLCDVRGLTAARRALEIAAAGGHGMLLEGPPGAGKSMIAKRLAGLLPDLDDAAALEVTRIHSATGLLRDGGLLRRPPLRAPHHTASTVALVGGGRPLSAGEVSLAHRGVLLLDEAPEFPRGALEALRQPLEDGVVTVARAEGVVTFPARFLLIATRNPCPCGMFGAGRGCLCLLADRDRYLRRLSGPILDRIDLCCWVEPVNPTTLLDAASAESSTAVRARVQAARRAEGPNAQAPLDWCVNRLDRRGRRELEASLSSLRGSARSVQQLARVAATVADLDGSDVIGPAHVCEALLLCAPRTPACAA